MTIWNDPLFPLFLGMSIFAILYALLIAYILRQDVSARNARRTRRT